MKNTDITIKPAHLLMNRVSLLGLIIGCFGLLTSISLLAVDLLSEHDNPYLGIFTYMIAPAFAVGGLILTTIGAIRMRRRLLRTGEVALNPFPVVDMNNPAHFWTVMVSVVGGFLFLAVSAVGTYRAYHFTESVAFCGKTCHSVMEPEHTAYMSSPHANVGCTTCHIGPGADFFVKAKVNGLKQVWNTMFDLYPRPIETPIHNLRPAKETCYTCHWPEKFFGSVLMERTYFRSSEEENDPWTIKMLINVGGGDSRHGRGQGIHWHMAVDNKIEYIAADQKRLSIPWVRQIASDGTETIYRTTDTNFTEHLAALAVPEKLAAADKRTMDCIDCHNRPSHQYHAPENSMNESMSAGVINHTIPNIKAIGVELLDGEYATHDEAMAAIDSKMQEEFPEASDDVRAAFEQIKRIYSVNFFPEMKVSWREYPEHIGHMISPGCFRCHDGKHVSDSGIVIRNDCNICHTIIAQGPGTKIDSITSGGLEFEHPEDVGDSYKTQRCDECHDGMPIL